MLADDAAHYKQFLSERQWLAVGGFCWTVVEPVTAPLGVADVVSRLGVEVHPLDVGQLSGEGYQDTQTFGWIVKAGAVAGRVMLFEENGFQGRRPEVLRWLSDGARVWSVYWNVDGESRLCYAVYGTVVTELEPSVPDRRWGKDPAALDEELQVLPDNSEGGEFEDWRPAAMAVVERCSGVRLDGDWLGRAGLYAIAREHPEDPRSPGGIGYWDPDLDARLRLASPDLQIAILSDLLSELAVRFNLAGEAAIQRVFERLPGLFDHYDQALMREFVVLGQRLGSDCEAERAEGTDRSGPAWRRLQAANAFHALLVAGTPYGERLDILRSAYHALADDDWPAIRAGIRARLTP